MPITIRQLGKRPLSPDQRLFKKEMEVKEKGIKCQFKISALANSASSARTPEPGLDTQVALPGFQTRGGLVRGQKTTMAAP